MDQKCSVYESKLGLETNGISMAICEVQNQLVLAPLSFFDWPTRL
jgi:hypothetical protein